MSNIAGGNQLLNPLTILRDHLKIAMDARVADLGCGSMGFFSLQAAALAGDKGQVYAVDILKEVLSSVEGRARQAGLYNIKTVWSNLEVVGAAKIPAASLDYALLVNLLFQIKKRHEVFGEAHRLLKDGGRLLVVDWLPAGGAIGPATEMRIDPEEIKQLAAAAGYTLQSEFAAGASHYGLIFKK
ncbi:TPA: hypothetical protein DCL28_03315 [Candidatus Komeilibacteria bacterium]|nr:MAG: hypothetical protein A2260_04465 [Candidatus Komeilibacteria bacterium RIFOXYA2_FULL_45_9]HAH04556.1 hypothetical protein [Candidatus Komeilibacteria bacterium]HBR13277.1 hypothetical protein [Candidatus Komeilibacteria bacterium]HBV02330.1 hypothetical protein [Candidatus Komeilibacteria bacterium]HCC73227.1 hypothetical protein [Candidatus Komeilibacteria bacterium]